MNLCRVGGGYGCLAVWVRCWRNKPFYQSRLQRKQGHCGLYCFPKYTAVQPLDRIDCPTCFNCFTPFKTKSSKHFKFHKCKYQLEDNYPHHNVDGEQTSENCISRLKNHILSCRASLHLSADSVITVEVDGFNGFDTKPYINCKNRSTKLLYACKDSTVGRQCRGTIVPWPTTAISTGISVGISHCTHEFHGDGPTVFPARLKDTKLNSSPRSRVLQLESHPQNLKPFHRGRDGRDPESQTKHSVDMWRLKTCTEAQVLSCWPWTGPCVQNLFKVKSGQTLSAKQH